MFVRPGSLDDLPAMAAVFRRAAPANEGDRDLLYEHPELTVLEPPAEDDGVLIAEMTGRVVGFATARALGDDAFMVTDLFVDPDHMRSGIGRALIDAVVAAATRSGRTRIEVEANRHAVAFYRRIGFVAMQEVQLEFGTALRMVMSVPIPLRRGAPKPRVPLTLPAPRTPAQRSATAPDERPSRGTGLRG